MSDGGGPLDRLRPLGPRFILLCFVVGLAASALLSLALAPPSGNVAVEDGLPLRASNGFTLTIDTGSGEDLQSGSPFIASNAIEIGRTEFIAASGVSANLTKRNASYVGVGSVSGGQVELNDTATVPAYGAENVGGTATFLRDLNVSQSNTTTEVVYNTGTQPDIAAFETGLPDGRGLVAVAPNGDIVDAAAVDGDGDALLDELPSGSQTLNLKEGASVLKIFNKSSPSTLVTEPIRTRFFNADGNLVRERTVSDGTVDLDGLDQSDAFTVRLADMNQTSTPNYQNTSIVLNELFDQTTAYLAPSTAPQDTIVFKLDDRSGQFPGGQTDLKIEELISKDFDGDGDVETKYKDVAGERFGSDNQATLQLTSGKTFRLQVRNEKTDQSRLLGNYQTEGDDTVTLTISDVKIEGATAATRGFVIDGKIINNSGKRYIQVNYKDPDNATSKLAYRIEFRKNNSRIAGGKIEGPLGTTTITQNITGHPTNLSYLIRYSVARNNEQYSGKLLVGKPSDLGVPLDSRWMGILGIIAIVAVGGLLVIIDDSIGALGMTVTAAFLTLVGVVSIPSAAIGMAGGISVLAIIGRQG